MQGKKKYVALVLFLLIGLMVFTFANPSSDEEKKKDDKNNKADIKDVVKDETKDKGEVTNQPEATENVVFNALDNRVFDNQGLNNINVLEIPEVSKETDGYDEALKAVEKAEDSLVMGDYNNAQDLVNDLKDSVNKDELNDRLENVLAGINASELVAKLEEMVNSAEKKADMNGARDYNTENEINKVVNDLANEVLKDSLNDRLNVLNGLLTDVNEPKITGLEDGSITNTLANVKITDENLYTITLNGEAYELGTELEKDGEYVLVVVDAAFNETTISFVYDKTAPVLAVKSTSIGTDEIYSRVDLSLHDNVGIAKAIVNGKEYARNGVWNDLNFQNVNNYVEGENTVELVDLAGNSSIIKFVIDRVAPEATLSMRTTEPTNKDLIVTMKTNEIIKTPAGWTKVDDTTYTKKYTKNTIEEVEIVDMAGNKAIIKVEITNIDKTAPVITIKNSSIGTDGVYSKVDLSLHDEVGLAKAIVNGKEYVRNGVWNDLNFQNVNNYIEGENTVELVDLAGNITTIKFIIDKTAPTITISGSVGENDIYSMINLKLHDENGLSKAIVNGKEYARNGVWNDLNFKNVNNYVEGENTVELVDLAGNVTAIKFIIDRIVPTGIITFSNNNGNQLTNKDVVVTLVTSEPVGTPAGWTKVDDLTFTKVYEANAKNEVVEFSDIAGNKTSITYEVKRIDKVAPEGVITASNGNGSIPTNEDITLTLKTNESILTPEGWTRVEDKVYTKVFSENTKSSVEITDKAGNKTVLKYEVKRIDKVAPELTVVDPNKYYVEAGSVYIDKGYSAYDAVDKDVTKMVKVTYTFQEQGSNVWKEVSSLDTTKLGVYKVTYTAYDKAGNTSKGTRVVAIQDTIAPKFIGIKNGFRYSEVIVNVDDVTLDNIKVYSYSTKETFKVENNTKLTEIGTYSIVATDKAGNSKQIYVAVE